MKKIIYIFIISFIAFSFLSCEKNEEIRKDTSVQIKKIIRSTKPNDVKDTSIKIKIFIVSFITLMVVFMYYMTKKEIIFLNMVIEE